MKKVVLAFSGGLDTSYCACYLSKEMGYEVHAVTVNTGGFDKEEQQALSNSAKELGVSSYQFIDATMQFYEECVRFLLFGNVLKNNTYPLSVSSERVFQALKIAEYAKEIKADAIAHGSTGAGNDQIRFDSIFTSVYSYAEIITPIRDNNLTREYEINYLKQNGYEYVSKDSQYSINKGLWGTSIGGKETLTSDKYLPEEAFIENVDESKKALSLKITFQKGEPTELDGQRMSSVELISELNKLGHSYGLGRDIHVGDTIIGIKGRVAFEAPAAIILIKAHHLLEKHTLSRNQLFMKDMISASYGNWVHEGLFLDPVIADVHSFLESSQKRVSGEVFIRVLPHRFIVEGINSDYDLMKVSGGKYGEENEAWTGTDARGFAKIYANSTRIYNSIDDGKS